MSKYIVTIASSSPLTKEAAKANFEANVLAYEPVENLNMAIEHLNITKQSFVLKAPAHLCIIEARYDCPNAIRYEKITYLDILNKNLKVMDSTATSLCRDNNIPLIVFGIDKPDNILKAVQGEKIGTLVEGE